MLKAPTSKDSSRGRSLTFSLALAVGIVGILFSMNARWLSEEKLWLLVIGAFSVANGIFCFWCEVKKGIKGLKLEAIAFWLLAVVLFDLGFWGGGANVWRILVLLAALLAVCLSIRLQIKSISPE